MKKPVRFLIVAIILGCGAFASFVLWQTRPVAEKKENKVVPTVVEVIPVREELIALTVFSQGIVESARRSLLASEVAGKVVSVSAKFDPGGIFSEGEPLLQLDSSDYEAALAQSQASLAEARTALELEKAKSDQARRDWERLGSGGKPEDLALRGPQLRSAEAHVQASAAAVKKAETDLARTTIKAPFHAVVAKTMTEIGSYVTPGAAVAEIFQTSPYEIRLPLSVDEMTFLKFNARREPVGEVKIFTQAAGITSTWQAKIIRTEREVDRASRSIYVVAEIDSHQSEEGITLQPGLFVQASISGRTVNNATRIPVTAFLDLTRVVIVDSANRLHFRKVKVLKRQGNEVIVSEGLKDGERLCLTELAGIVEGAEVTTIPWKPHDRNFDQKPSQLDRAKP